MLVWARVNNGYWNLKSYANPATGIGGFYVPTGSSKNMYVELQMNFGDEKVTANFGASAFSYAIPSGFTPGWLINGVTPDSLDTNSSINATLTNNDLTMQTATSGFACARTTTSKPNGNIYFELKADSIHLNNPAFSGFYTTLGTAISGTTAIVYCLFGNPGYWTSAGATIVLYGTPHAGDIISYAISLTSARMVGGVF